MQGFKGLIGKNLQSDQAFAPITKKMEESRKITQASNDYFQLTYKSFECYSVQLEKILQDNYTEEEITPEYYQQFLDIFEEYNTQLKTFTQSLNGTFKEMTSLCSAVLTQSSNQFLVFQHLIRDYQVQQGILSEMAKKYFRSLKTIQSSIQAYKTSFTDVKLIYNSDERFKRYSSCLNDYQTICQEYGLILQKVDKLNLIKELITKQYEKIYDQDVKVLKAITSRKIYESKNFTVFYCNIYKNLLNFLVDRKILLQTMSLQSIFGYFTSWAKPEYFNCELKPQVYKQCPPVLFYHAELRDEYLHKYSRLLVDLIKEISAKIEDRKLVNRKIIDFQTQLVKTIEKSFFPSLKQTLNFFEKNKKKISEVYGKRVTSFIKSANSILQLALGINDKLIKSIAIRVIQAQNYINDDSKLLDFLLKELNINVERFVGKKEIKKIKNTQSVQFTEEQPITDVVKYRNQIRQKAEFLIHLVNGFQEKMNSNYQKIKKVYNQTVNDIFLSNNELYSLAIEYQSTYFGNQEFQINYKKYEAQMQQMIVKLKQFYLQIPFGVLIKDKKTKISFDGQIHKFQQFKKLKKPTELKIQHKQSIKLTDKQLSQDNKSVVEVEVDGQNSQSKPNCMNNNIHVTTKDPKDMKYMQILKGRVILQEGQQLIKTFACGLSDNIILQGRLFITSQRMCFHSKFNRSNVFFGDTFIDVPKNDIKKIQKRTNAIFFDNSISLTTINGQIFLTSFFSRDEAYNLLCRTFDINQDLAFEEQPTNHQAQQQSSNILPELDDVSQEQAQVRQTKIMQLISKMPFKEIHSVEVEFPNLTAYIAFKLFYSWQEITINKKKYKSYLHYYRQAIQYKDIQCGQWRPNMQQYLNAGSIKANCPLQFEMDVNQIVPLPNTGIPFMPKTAKSYENVKVWIISKEKCVMEAKIKTVGAPYSDTFQLYIRTWIQSSGTNKCKFKYQFSLNIIKKTIMTSIIESRTLEDVTRSMKDTTDAFLKYFKNLIKEKQNKLKQPQNNQHQNHQNHQQLQQLQQLQQQNNILQNQLKSQNKLKQKYRNFLILSILLNILFIVIFISS